VASLAPAPGSSASIRFIASARGSRARLRVGVFADRARQPSWLFEALARVAASDCAELAFVSIGHHGTGPGAAVPPLLGLYRAVDRRLFGTDHGEERDIGLLVPAERRNAPAQPVIDVAFAIGAVDDAALAALARHGVWRYCFGDQHEVSEPLAAVREVFDAHPVVASGLRIRRAGAGDRVACASWSRAVPFSLARTRATLLPKTSTFLARALHELHASGPSWFDEATAPAVAAANDAAPAGTALLGGVGKVASRIARRAAESSLTVGQWQLAFRFGGDAAAWTGSLEGFHRLVPPADRFWADPFPVTVNGRHYIFLEELPFAAGKGHISVVEVDAAGGASAPRRVLERDYHLSYPFLLEHEGRLYMIPETANNRTVEIYRCVEFPHRWKLERVLLRDVWCADATLHRGADRWWMFASFCVDGGEVNDELHLFHAESPLGDWKPHRRNPARSDVRGARPAGRLFERNGELYRPGQVCTPIYGAAIAIHRVTRLDEQGYAEEEVARIAPRDPGILGIHTLNRAADFCVTDAFLRRSRWGA
jgi:hypothetical protein